MSTNPAPPKNTAGNRRTLGALWIVYAILRLAAAILFVLYSGTATVMFGALLTRVADPYTLMAIFHVLYICGICIAVLAGVLGLLAGIAMLGGKSSARPLALAASFFSLCDLPLGTTLGIYTLIIFLP
ncbi:MAG: hypothetical protein ACRD51_12460 [Candidatus Acidiferrum sp.]